MRSIGIFLAATAVIAGMAVAADSNATASIIHYGPGQECVAAGSNTTRPNYYGSRARNDTTSSVLMMCPMRITDSLVLQNPSNEATLVAAAVDSTGGYNVAVEDWSSTSNFSCYAQVCDAHYTNCSTSANQASARSDGQTEYLGFTTLSIGAAQVGYIYCTVPAKTGGGDRSAIVSYRVETVE